ncbi:MAG: TerB family tellurite resistance protein [Deltaproteobacteria bacterium]|nr:TerB family tellurite resistance protein [Deltaproteobacteria bacterium]
MLKINTDAIGSLRERMLEKGGAPSIILSGPDAAKQQGHPLAGDPEAMALFDATFEGMFLMLASDGVVNKEELEVLRGAVRELTAGVMRTAQIEELAGDCAERLQKEGEQACLERIAAVLKKDETATEAAFVLAAVVAFADEEVTDEEDETLNQLADLLELSGERANELLDQLERAQKE